MSRSVRPHRPHTGVVPATSSRASSSCSLRGPPGRDTHHRRGTGPPRSATSSLRTIRVIRPSQVGTAPASSSLDPTASCGVHFQEHRGPRGRTRPRRPAGGRHLRWRRPRRTCSRITPSPGAPMSSDRLPRRTALCREWTHLAVASLTRHRYGIAWPSVSTETKPAKAINTITVTGRRSAAEIGFIVATGSWGYGVVQSYSTARRPEAAGD